MGIRVMDSNDQERERGITILAKVGFASSILVCDTHRRCAHGEAIRFLDVTRFFVRRFTFALSSAKSS